MGGHCGRGAVFSAIAKENSERYPEKSFCNAKKSTRGLTDGSIVYRRIRDYLPHEVIDHDTEYVRGDIHTQGIENYWSLLKRGVYGVFHHVGDDYLPMYLSEFEFRFNRRKISDAERFAALMAQVQGRLLWYCRTPQPQNPHA